MKTILLDYSKKKWLILLLISACLCAVPAIYNGMNQTKAAYTLAAVVFVLQWALVVWFGICVIKDARKYAVKGDVMWYQKAVRILSFVLIMAIMYFEYMKLELRTYNPAYMVEGSFWDNNKMIIVGSLLYVITINAIFSLIYYINETTEDFVKKSVKTLLITVVPLYALSLLTTIASRYTGVVLEVIITWLLWISTMYVMIKIFYNHQN